MVIRNDGTDGHVVADAVSFANPDASEDDIDGDGLPNWWERRHFGSDVAADPMADVDVDGMVNLHELKARTDPRDVNSVLRIRGVDVVPARRLRIAWSSESNVVYSVQRSPNVESGFQSVTTAPATPPLNVYLDRDPGDRSYYRIDIPE